MNQLYDCLNTSTNEHEGISAAGLKVWWDAVRLYDDVTRLDVLAAVMMFGGHVGMLTPGEYDELHELVQKAKSKLLENSNPSQTVRTLFASLTKAPMEPS